MIIIKLQSIWNEIWRNSTLNQCVLCEMKTLKQFLISYGVVWFERKGGWRGVELKGFANGGWALRAISRYAWASGWFLGEIV